MAAYRSISGRRRTDLTMRMVPRWNAGGGLLAGQFSPHRGAETVLARLTFP
jgi:hypothetical protein